MSVAGGTKRVGRTRPRQQFGRDKIYRRLHGWKTAVSAVTPGHPKVRTQSYGASGTPTSPLVSRIRQETTMDPHLSAARSHHFYNTGRFLRHDGVVLAWTGLQVLPLCWLPA